MIPLKMGPSEVLDETQEAAGQPKGAIIRPAAANNNLPTVVHGSMNRYSSQHTMQMFNKMDMLVDKLDKLNDKLNLNRDDLSLKQNQSRPGTACEAHTAERVFLLQLNNKSEQGEDSE